MLADLRGFEIRIVRKLVWLFASIKRIFHKISGLNFNGYRIFSKVRPLL
jgi:hypothetical protein